MGAALRCGRRTRGGVDRQLRRRAGALPARRGSAGARGQAAARAYPPPARQERPDRCRAPRPPRPGRELGRGREGHHRDRRGDPPAADRARRCRQGAQRRAERADRPGRQRPRGPAPPAAGPQDHAWPSDAVRSAAPRPTRLLEPVHAAKAALRSLARRVIDLDTEIATRDRQLMHLVATAAPATTARIAVSTGHAGALLVTAGQNIDRLRSEASFAALCAAGPIPVSSGRRDRHRLNYGANRDANRALHMIAVCRLRYCARTRAYAERRTAEGKTKTEI